MNTYINVLEGLREEIAEGNLQMRPYFNSISTLEEAILYLKNETVSIRYRRDFEVVLEIPGTSFQVKLNYKNDRFNVYKLRIGSGHPLWTKDASKVKDLIYKGLYEIMEERGQKHLQEQETARRMQEKKEKYQGVSETVKEITKPYEHFSKYSNPFWVEVPYDLVTSFKIGICTDKVSADQIKRILEILNEA